MYNIIKFWITSLCAIFIFSCDGGLITWEYLDVSCNAIINQNYFSADYLQLDFSRMPDPQSAVKLLQLKNHSAIVNTDTHWVGKSLLVRPAVLWQKGAFYSLTLEGSLQMDDGRFYTVSFERSFKYGDPSEEFYLLSGVFLGDSLQFAFVKPPSIASFNEKFSLSPQTDIITLFSADGKTVTVKPKNNWALNTIYTWTIKDMISYDDYLMAQTYSDTFKGPFDTTLPELIQVCPVTYETNPHIWHTGARLDGELFEQQAIGFIFSKPMEEQSIRTGISFYPNVNGYIIKETEQKFIFIPEEKYQLKKQYRLTISQNIKDAFGLSLFEDKLYFFTTQNEYLKISSIVFDSTSAPMAVDGTIVNYTLLNSIPPLTLQATITFSTKIQANIREKVVDSISLDVLFPLSTANPVPITVSWVDPGFILNIKWEGLQKSSVSIERFYILTIKGGKNNIINSAGEYLEEDVCVIFKAL